MGKLGALGGMGLGVAVLLSGCARDPSITESDVWHGGPNDPVVSVCYTAATATREDVLQLAASKCPEETPLLRLIDEDTFFNNCPLSKRVRATFLCVAQ